MQGQLQVLCPPAYASRFRVFGACGREGLFYFVMFIFQFCGNTYSLHCSSFFGLPYRILNI